MIPRYLLNLAGEYRVTSELNKRGAFATVTYGNRKSADVYAIGENGKALKIEVKASQRKSFVTGIGQKRLGGVSRAPDFWVLAQFLPTSERFFVLSNAEICAVQKKRNRKYARAYEIRNGRKLDISKGVDNVTVKDVEIHEGQWKKLIDQMGGPESRRMRAAGMRYVSNIPRSLTEGRVLVHNSVAPQRGLGVNGFRAWTQYPDETLIECHCDWAGVDLHGLKHYRIG